MDAELRDLERRVAASEPGARPALDLARERAGLPLLLRPAQLFHVFHAWVRSPGTEAARPALAPER